MESFSQICRLKEQERENWRHPSSQTRLRGLLHQEEEWTQWPLMIIDLLDGLISTKTSGAIIHSPPLIEALLKAAFGGEGETLFSKVATSDGFHNDREQKWQWYGNCLQNNPHRLCTYCGILWLCNSVMCNVAPGLGVSMNTIISPTLRASWRAHDCAWRRF